MIKEKSTVLLLKQPLVLHPVTEKTGIPENGYIFVTIWCINMEQNKQDFIEWWNQAPFFKWADLEIMEAENGEARLKLNVQRHHRGGGGTKAVHGGIIAYMFDGLLSAAARSLAPDHLIAMATLTLNVQYLQLLNVEEIVIGTASVQKAGKSTAFVEGALYDDQGEICSTCTGIFRYFYKKPNSREQSKL